LRALTISDRKSLFGIFGTNDIYIGTRKSRIEGTIEKLDEVEGLKKSC